MLFLLVGVVYDRAHHRDINGFGGIAVVVPRYTGFVTLAFFAAIGLPGLSGFIGEVMVFVGAFQNPTLTWHVIASVFGIVIGAGYMLWSFQRVFMGPLNEKYKALTEINAREIFTLVPLAVIVVVLGVWPNFALDLIQGSLKHLVDTLAGH